MKENVLKFFLLSALSLLTLPVISQDLLSVTGSIVDESGEPLIGCTVQAKEGKVGTVSDFDGKFKLQVPKGSVLSFTFLGYKTQNLKAAPSMKVTMSADSRVLDEVVAIGYGTMKRSDLTGAVVSVKGEDLLETSAATFDQMLQGKAAGVSVTGNSGAAGASTSVQIRGVNSISASNEPIYVIDGVIFRPDNGADVYSNPLADINPNDIENIEVLKDASATAIYGSQAANGVIIVTMKKGQTTKEDKKKKTGSRFSIPRPKINLKASLGWESIPKKVDVMNLREFGSWVHDVLIQEGRTIDPSSPYYDPSLLGDGTDWQDELFRTGLKQEYNLSLRGGDKKLTYSLSGGLFKQQGIVINNDFRRHNVRANVTYKFNQYLDMGFTTSFGWTKRNTGMSTWGLTETALGQLPNMPVKNEDGSWGKGGYDSLIDTYTPNPVAVASVVTRLNNTHSARFNVYANIKPTKWLTWHHEYTYDTNTDHYKYLKPTYDVGGSRNTEADHQDSRTYNRYQAYSTNLTGKWKLNKVHDVTAMVGFEASSRYKDYHFRKTLGGSDTDLSVEAGDMNRLTFDKWVTNTRFTSFFGRGVYSYRGKYMATTTLRHDGCSLFERGRRFGTFPSVALAWRISEEPWFGSLIETFSNIKLRAGWGLVGNANLADNTFLPNLYRRDSAFPGDAYKTTNMPNYDGLTWEKTNSWNVGIDIGLWDNRVEIIFDAYIKKIRDLLLQTAQPYYVGIGTSGTGTTAQWANVGSMRNRGLEMTIKATPIKSRHFTWTTSMTGTMNENKVTNLNNINGFIDRTLTYGQHTEAITRTAEGHSISQFYGFEVLGRINNASDFLRNNGDGTSTVIKATPNYRVGTIVKNTDALTTTVGDLLFKDNNGDGIIDDNDRNFLGSALPKFTAGWNNTFKYRQFTLTCYLYGSFGGKVFNWSRRRMDEPSRVNSTISNKYPRVLDYAHIGYYDGNGNNKDVWNQYVLPGANDGITRIDREEQNFNSRVSDRYVEDASFVKIKNIILSYSFNKKQLRPLHLQGLTLSMNIQNVYTFTGYTGYDPEVGAQNGQFSMSGQGMLMYGVDTGKVPTPRSFIFTLDATF